MREGQITDSRMRLGDPAMDSVTARLSAGDRTADSLGNPRSTEPTATSRRRPTRHRGRRLGVSIAFLAAAAGVGDAGNVNTKVSETLFGKCVVVDPNFVAEGPGDVWKRIGQVDPNGNAGNNADCTTEANPNIPYIGKISPGTPVKIAERRSGLIR